MPRWVLPGVEFCVVWTACTYRGIL
jgi:hypothetical protein